jgi:pimeloyl-ACP methyl ester carboxylesterase
MGAPPATVPKTVMVEHDGLAIAALDWGSDGRPLLLMHPNGFCAGMWDPLAQQLRGDYRPIAIDIRGHGASDPPRSDEEYAFAAAASDIGPVLDALGVTEIVALGHSLGGACVILFDQLHPGIVQRALLCEAIAFPPMPRGATPPDGPGRLVISARRRRAVWPDRATVHESYASRPPLNVLEAAVLDAYVQWGFHDRPDGTIELACAPEVEARFFEAAATDDGARNAFDQLPSLRDRVTIVRGDRTDLPALIFDAQAAAVGAPIVELDGDHFFLQENTARAAALVREHL